MKRLLLPLLLLTACGPAPAHAQALPPSPALFTLYAKMGALTFGQTAREAGNYPRACLAWSHLLYIEQQDGTPIDQQATTRRLLSGVCSSSQ